MKFTVTKKQEVTQDIELCEFMKRDTNFYKFDFEKKMVTRIKLFEFKECGIYPCIDQDTITFHAAIGALNDLKPITFQEWRNALEDVLDKLNIV